MNTNTAPRFAKFTGIPLREVRPSGWMQAYLAAQRNGLTGHLDRIGYPFDTPGWAGPWIPNNQGAPWWPYEQTAYWIDGMIRCGLLLHDAVLLRKARRHLDYVLRRRDRDGYLGPAHLKQSDHAQNRWPHAVLFRAFMADGTARIARALHRHYLSDTAPHSLGRDICNLEPMLWAFARTGDRRLLRRARQAYRNFNRSRREKASTARNLAAPGPARSHGVSFLEIGKLPAILFLHTGNAQWLRAAVGAFRKLDRHHLLVDGVPSASEFLAGRSSLESHETCVVADYAWSATYLLMATGDRAYADRIERACLNAGPGSVRDDFRALQYFSCPNQVLAAHHSNHNAFGKGDAKMAYRPLPAVECCAGNVNRIMPIYAGHLWMRDRRGGLVAMLYGPSRVETAVCAGGARVVIDERTAFPFSDRVDFAIGVSSPVRFGLSFRIPSWCSRPRLALNGKPVRARRTRRGFLTLSRRFRSGDRVTLVLPMTLRVKRWPAGGVYVERGPLLYALRIRERRRAVRVPGCPKRFLPFDLYPATRWNYVLAVRPGAAVPGVVIRRRKAGLRPWSPEAAPIEIEIPARRVPGWRLVRTRKLARGYSWGHIEHTRGRFAFTPPLPPKRAVRRALKRTQRITLVPYGCTRLRITLFPEPAGR